MCPTATYAKVGLILNNVRVKGHTEVRLTWLAFAFTSPLLNSSSTTLMSLGTSTAANAASMMGV